MQGKGINQELKTVKDGTTGGTKKGRKKAFRSTGRNVHMTKTFQADSSRSTLRNRKQTIAPSANLALDATARSANKSGSLTPSIDRR